MIGDLQRRASELRFLGGIEKVEHVPYPAGDEFWVRFNGPLDQGKLSQIVKAHNFEIIRFASIPSRLPKKLAEIVWNGVTWIIAPKMTGWQKFKSALGFEPNGTAKVAVDLHTGEPIFIARDEEGIKLLYEYLGVKYVAPAPSPPKPATPATKPTPVPAKPVTPDVPAVSKPSPLAPPATTSAKVPPPTQAPPATAPSQPAQQAPLKPADSSQPKKSEEAAAA